MCAPPRRFLLNSCDRDMSCAISRGELVSLTMGYGEMLRHDLLQRVGFKYSEKMETSTVSSAHASPSHQRHSSIPLLPRQQFFTNRSFDFIVVCLILLMRLGDTSGTGSGFLSCSLPSTLEVRAFTSTCDLVDTEMQETGHTSRVLPQEAVGDTRVCPICMYVCIYMHACKHT